MSMRDFIWGAATAAYQVEGAATEDGRGESVWDRFAATPGKVRNGESGAIACDFYHRYPDDIQLMRELGLDAFRFSIAWPRVLPEGRGRVNEAGLDFYDRLVDALLEAGITPFPTLFHWDTPQALDGGWTNRATAEAFVEYAEVVARRLGDRVTYWATHNEPWVVAWLGHAWGWHAPGAASEAQAIDVAHHLLLSHGRAVEVLRRESPGAQVGIVLNLSVVDGDPEAARVMDGSLNRWFLDPVFRGGYPADLLDRYSPPVQPGDLEAIAAPIDWLGVNNYFRFVVGADGEPVRDPDAPATDMGWEVHPESLYRLLMRVERDYAPPAMYVTENGAAYGDARLHDGSVPDPERTAYLESYIAAVRRAADEGASVRGYFVWSFLDNFEWSFGYAKRFGIVYVDYPTLERVPKGSFYWYRDLIASTRPESVAA